MAKYARLYERVAASADTLGVSLHEPEPATEVDLLRVHTPDYVHRAIAGTLSDSELRRIGFPWSPGMIDRSRRSSGGTMAALASAIEGDGVAVNLAGGTHHAQADRGGGYCVFNDSVIAARAAQARGLAKRLLIVDLDVHQGNGTASIVADDPTIFAFSMHSASNYPAVKVQGDLDVELPDGCSDARYLDLLATHLPRACEAAKPDAVLYLAGADPFVGDRLGHLSLTKPGLRQRDRFVVDFCQRHGLPLSISMAGGYAPDVDDIVDIHFGTVSEAAALFRRLNAAPEPRAVAHAR
jgi:acetoin utilization deacetylase AcuC-like enzyme